jgi:hypothetical protein
MNSALIKVCAMSHQRHNGPKQQSVVGYRPVVFARQGRMLGIRQPLDGPVFETLEDAEPILPQWTDGAGLSART